MTYLVLHVRPYDFESEGQRVQGVSVTYLDLSAPGEGDELGYAPLTITAEPHAARYFNVVPGLYSLDFRQRRGARGRPQIVLAGASLEGEVALGGDA